MSAMTSSTGIAMLAFVLSAGAATPAPMRSDANLIDEGAAKPAAVLGSAPAAAGPVRLLHARIAALMPRLNAALRERVARAIVADAELTGVDPLLVLALIRIESAFDPHAVSAAGAVGLMQLKDATMRAELARSGLPASNPHDPVASVRAGIRYLRRLIDAFGGVDVALMAYNAGPNRILGHQRRGRIPERFHLYPRKVKHEMERLRRTAGVTAPASLRANHAISLVGSCASDQSDRRQELFTMRRGDFACGAYGER
jgi:soluble lytic murein transglycosylase-like protein